MSETNLDLAPPPKDVDGLHAVPMDIQRSQRIFFLMAPRRHLPATPGWRVKLNPARIGRMMACDSGLHCREVEINQVNLSKCGQRPAEIEIVAVACAKHAKTCITGHGTLHQQTVNFLPMPCTPQPRVLRLAVTFKLLRGKRTLGLDGDIHRLI
jgi:hypothetical protein